MSGERGPLSKPNAIRRAGRSGSAGLTQAAAPLPQEPPEHLGDIGRALWLAACELSWVQASDAVAVRRLAELEDERAVLAASVAEHGPLLERPIVTPRGEIAGSEYYSHPLLGEIRRIDTQVTKLRTELGLSPTTRARLGIRLLEGETTLDRLRRDRARDDVDPRLVSPLESWK